MNEGLHESSRARSMIKEDSYTPEEVDYGFGGIFAVSEPFRNILAKSLAKLPKSVVGWATENLLARALRRLHDGACRGRLSRH